MKKFLHGLLELVKIKNSHECEGFDLMLEAEI